MRIRSLRIAVMPGFPSNGPVLEDLDRGMNVVIGANGSGKTTLAMAVRWLLWPSTADRNAPRMVFAHTYDNLPLMINQSRSEGQGKLKLPPDSHADCFTITADDLFDGGTASFAERVKRAITGQVSVDSLYRKEEAYRGLESELIGLRKQYEGKVREIEKRHGLISTLPELRRRLDEGRKAEQRLRSLKDALELREIDARLASMKGMENAKPTDLGNAQRLKDEIHALGAGIAELERRSRECLWNIEKTGLKRVPVNLGEIRSLLENAKAREHRMEGHREDLAGLLRGTEGIPFDVGLADLDKVLSAAVEHDRALERIRELENRRAALEAGLGGLRAEELENGRDILIRWLAKKEHGNPIIPAGLLVLAVFLLVGGDRYPAVSALALFVWSLLAPGVQMSLLQSRYRRTGLPGPSSWGGRDVIGALRSLETALDDHRSLKEIGNELVRLRAEADDLRRRSLGIREKTGVNSAAGLEELVRRLERSGEVEELRGRIGEAEDRLRGDLLRLGELLGEWGVSPPDDVRQAVGAVEFLEEGIRVFTREEASLENLRREAEASRGKLAELEKELNGIFSRNGLETGDFESLKERDGKLGPYLYLTQQRRNLMEKHGRDETCPPEALEDEIRRAEETVATLDDIREKVTLAMAAEREMEGSAELAEILSDIVRAERKVEAVRLSNGRVRIRNRLLDTVKKKYQVKIQPPVVKRASYLLAGFTGSRYSLNPVGLEDSEITVLDSETGGILPLEHLSRGTRMQLLLALKVAFAELVEAGHRIPLFLDEVLANSDLERFRGVSLAMAELVRGGRQIFYLTCREPDASLIQQVFQESGAPPVKVFRIDRATPGVWPDYDDLLESVPLPGELSYDDYVRLLGPPGVVRGMPPGRIHPAWVLHSTDTLYKLLKAGLNSLGKASVSAASVLTGGEARELERAGAVAEQVLALYARGRPEPLSRAALEESPVGRSTLLEKVWSLSAEVGHVPEKLLGELRKRRVPGFRTALMDEFEEYLKERGLLPRERPLTRDEARPLVLGSVEGDTERIRTVFERLWSSLESCDGPGG